MDGKKIATMVQDALGEGFEAKYTQVRKNNGIILDGVLIREEGSSIAPVIYYRDEWGPEENVCRRILDIYREEKAGGNQVQVPKLGAEKILSCVHRRLIMAAGNEEYIADMVHTNFLDMVVTYYLNLGNRCTISITKKLMESFGLDEQTLDAAAEKNDIASAVIVKMGEIIPDAEREIPEEMDGITEEDVRGVDDESIIATNTETMFGASTMMLPDCMGKISEAFGGGDFYILPSSIHEVIAVKDSAGLSTAYLSSMVRQVNQTTVSRGDVLGSSVYKWNHKKHTAEIVA